MTRKESLAVLIAKVEAGDIEGAPFWKVWMPEDPQCGRWAFIAHRAANGSLDAAKALHEAVLGDGYVSDGYKWCIWGSGKVSVWHVIKGWHHVGDVPDPHQHASSPARAWLLAILRAIHAQEADT